LSQTAYSVAAAAATTLAFEALLCRAHPKNWVASKRREYITCSTHAESSGEARRGGTGSARWSDRRRDKSLPPSRPDEIRKAIVKLVATSDCAGRKSCPLTTVLLVGAVVVVVGMHQSRCSRGGAQRATSQLQGRIFAAYVANGSSDPPQPDRWLADRQDMSSCVDPLGVSRDS